MTIVVYRDGVIASDSASWSEDTCCGSIKKCGRSEKGLLWGVTGQALVVQDVAKWADDPMSEPPTYDDQNEVIVVWPDGTVKHLEKGRWTDLLAPYHVAGSGMDIAMGALMMGATAVQAVAAAIEHNAYCAGEIQSYSLHEEAESDPEIEYYEVPDDVVLPDPATTVSDWRGGLGLK